MKMVGHTYSPMHLHLPSLGLLKGWYLPPFLFHRPPYLRERHPRRFEVIIKPAKQLMAALPIPHHESDEIHARSVVVVPRIMRTI